MKKFDVLITDHIAEEGIEILEKAESINYEIRAGISNADLKPILGNYDAVITRSGTTVDADLLENTGKLKIIGRAGVGLDNVDIETASKKGLIVMNAPTGNTYAAVELTMGMILAACRKIPAANQSVKAGEWNRKKFMGIQLLDKTLGIVGIGRIGGNVVTRCKAFGMKVLAYDPYVKQSRAENLGVTLCNSLDEVLSQADVITLHTPLTEETKGMIAKPQFDMMKDGAVFVNCARGGLVDEDALYEAVKSGKLFSAATDVFSYEPPKGMKLLELENIFVTPHIGANTHEGQKGVAVIICEQIVNALEGRSYANAVNIPYMKSLLPEELQRYFELARSMGRLASQFINGRPEEIRFTMVGKRFEEDFGERTFDSPFNYQPFTIASLKGFLEVVLEDSVSFINSPYLAKDRNIYVMESKTDHYDKYNDLLVLTVKTSDGKETTIGGTLFAENIGKILFIDNYTLDLEASGNYIYFRNNDRPGIVGKVATLLGENNINIANFGLARVGSKGSEAISFVLVDDKVSPDVVKQIANLDDIIEAKYIRI